MSEFPEPPRGEVDGDGRHVHPYVRDPEPDPSARAYTTEFANVTVEDRSRESRLAFHAAEALLGHLTPMGAMYLIEGCLARVWMDALAEEMEAMGVTAEQMDVRGEVLPFEALHRSRFEAINAIVQEILETCPSCGGRHGGLVPGGYVNSVTGESVKIVRVEESRVLVSVQVSSERYVERIYDREWVEANFVPGESVEVLGDPHGC